jgi:hypothetical protein
VTSIHFALEEGRRKGRFQKRDRAARSNTLAAGPPLLHKAAMDAVRQWVFSPYLADGEPVETEVMVKVEFGLGG